MSESAGGPEVCVFCDPENDVEIGEDGEDEDDDDFRDDASRGSVSITLELPDDFDVSDPEAMSKLIKSATQSIGSRRSRSRGQFSPKRDNPPHAVSRNNSRQRSTRSGGLPKNRLPPGRSGTPRSNTQQQTPLLPPRHQLKHTPPRLTPEGRHSRTQSRTKSRPKPRTQSRTPSRSRPRSRNSGPVLPSSHVVVSGIDDDDTSHLTDDNKSSASNTLGAILNQIETYKGQLNKPIDMTDAESFREGMANRSDAAALIEKLSVAATAVKNLEDM